MVNINEIKLDSLKNNENIVEIQELKNIIKIEINNEYFKMININNFNEINLDVLINDDKIINVKELKILLN